MKSRRVKFDFVSIPIVQEGCQNSFKVEIAPPNCPERTVTFPMTWSQFAEFKRRVYNEGIKAATELRERADRIEEYVK